MRGRQISRSKCTLLPLTTSSGINGDRVCAVIENGTVSKIYLVVISDVGCSQVQMASESQSTYSSYSSLTPHRIFIIVYFQGIIIYSLCLLQQSAQQHFASHAPLQCPPSSRRYLCSLHLAATDLYARNAFSQILV